MRNIDWSDEDDVNGVIVLMYYTILSCIFSIMVILLKAGIFDVLIQELFMALIVFILLIAISSSLIISIRGTFIAYKMVIGMSCFGIVIFTICFTSFGLPWIFYVLHVIVNPILLFSGIIAIQHKTPPPVR